MSWEQIVGHAPQVALFRQIVRSGRLAHAYLFVGPPGIGKKAFATQLAKCLLCQKRTEAELESCDVCPGCQQVRAITHPDFFSVGCPEGKRELPVAVFLGPPEKRGKAGLLHDLSHTPMAGGRKVAIIDDANAMNDEGGNALLKTLEEPPPHSVLILVADTIDGILPTIRSRCQVIRFAPLALGDVANLLTSTGMIDDPAVAREAAALSEGSLALAAQLADPELRALRELLYDGLSAKIFDSNALSVRILENLASGGADTGEQRLRAHLLIKFCVEFYRSVLWELAGCAGDQFSGRTAQAARFGTRFNSAAPEQIEVVVALLERSLAAESHLEQNTAVPLCLEALLNELGRITRAGFAAAI